MKLERVNIGMNIEQKLNELGISKSEFGRRIGIPQQNVNRILEKPNIDTERLIAISEALEYNFFSDYSSEYNKVVASGEGSVAVNGNNNSNVIAGCDAALLQERIKHLEELLAEKERLITVLMERK